MLRRWKWLWTQRTLFTRENLGYIKNTTNQLINTNIYVRIRINDCTFYNYDNSLIISYHWFKNRIKGLVLFVFPRSASFPSSLSVPLQASSSSERQNLHSILLLLVVSLLSSLTSIGRWRWSWVWFCWRLHLLRGVFLSAAAFSAAQSSFCFLYNSVRSLPYSVKCLENIFVVIRRCINKVYLNCTIVKCMDKHIPDYVKMLS